MKTTNITRTLNNSASQSSIASRRGLIWRFFVPAGAIVCLLLFSVTQAKAVADTTPHSIWSDSAIPTILSAADSTGAELGLKFRSAVDGYITGIRFYKGPNNPGPHVGNLWTSAGVLRGSVSFDNETASGWQTQALASPVPISANTTYVVSYHAPGGGYSADSGYFATSGVDSPPLRVLANGEDGPNGVYAYSPTVVFPNGSFNAANYWVDVVFVQSLGADVTPPTVSSVSPADGATGVSVSTAVTVTFSEAMDASTINQNTILLRDALANPVPASFSYNASNYSAVLTPTTSLSAPQTYTVTVVSGAAGVKDVAGNALAADFTSSFTTGAQLAFSIWDNSVTPGQPSANDTSSIEVGLRFRSAIDGNVTAIRFYKGAANPGPHVGSLWTGSWLPLGSVVFQNETATPGWQEQALASPVPITSNTTYVVSYHAPSGGYAADLDYFATAGFDHYPLRALANGEDGNNGIYAYSASSTFPNQFFRAANYWVDVVVSVPADAPCAADKTPPVITAFAANTTLAAGAGCQAAMPDLTSQLVATDNCPGALTVTQNPVVGTPLGLGVHAVTWTVKDASGNIASCSANMTVVDITPPTIAGPRDVILLCADCNTDPSNTGMATAADNCSVAITYSDVVAGTCPKVVKRTWTATDGARNKAATVQTITCLPATLVTEGSGSLFDRNTATPVQDFRLVFIQDPQKWPSYKLAACNPGQFRYNVCYTGSPGQQVTLDLALPYPFVTQGANPIQAYDWVTVTGAGSQPCFTPGSAFFSSSQQVTLTSYVGGAGTTAKVPVTLTVPPSGVVYLTVSLAYGLKGQTGFAQNAVGAAVNYLNTSKVLIPNGSNCVFSVSGAQTGSTSIQNNNTFKKIPGVAGLVLDKTTLDPVAQANVSLADAKGVALGSAVTDDDGFYMIAYKNTGKAATFYISIATPEGYAAKTPMIMKANAFVRQDFLVP